MGIEPETGRAEGRWVRGAIIGVGASGTVSLATSSSNGQHFAVKSAAGFSVALDNEYRILGCLDSPYIVRCLGRAYSVENGVGLHNLFMEYMPGGSVGDLLSNFGGPLVESVIRAYTRGILRGIYYLHSEGIVHCDIKGKNVLVGANGVKLADFGSARRIGSKGKGERQEALQLRGTFLWMAPEVVNQVEQGPASDIWSLGCTVLEMATGRPPWSQVSNPLAAMYQIGCTEELPEFPVSLSPRIRDFLEKCFWRDPKQRSTSTELLNHPFLNENYSAMNEEEAIRGLGSPTSNLDFRKDCSAMDEEEAIRGLGFPTSNLDFSEDCSAMEEEEAIRGLGSPTSNLDFRKDCSAMEEEEAIRGLGSPTSNLDFMKDCSAMEEEEAIRGMGSPTTDLDFRKYCFAMEEEDAIRGLGPLTSNLDFRNEVWDSFFSHITTSRSLSMPSPASECNAEVYSDKSNEQCPRPSPRDRVMALAAACEFKEVAERLNWSAISPGQWIVVRSSSNKSPNFR